MTFYQLQIDEGKRRKFAYGILLEKYPMAQINCETCGRRWDKDILSYIMPGIKMSLSNDNHPDFLSLLVLTLVSDKVKSVLDKTQVSGYRMHSINSIKREDVPKDVFDNLKENGFNVDKFSNCVEKYNYMDVSLGAETHAKSEIVLKSHCDSCGYSEFITIGKTYIDPFHEIFIKRNSWNGNMIFRVRELGQQLFCTEDFVSLCKKYKFTGICFKEVISI